MNKVNYLLIGIVMLFTACNSSMKGVPEKYNPMLETAFQKSGENRSQLKAAIEGVSEEQREGMAYLISYMPEIDLTSLKSDFLIKNVKLAYKAREEFSWCKELPDSIFFNEVLPYASLNERRDDWREDFYNRFAKYVKDCKTIEEAIKAVNDNIKDEVEVEYNTHRKKPDQSPYESMEQGRATCSGLSILLADAFRAVGIPSRVGGTPNWWDDRGNHNWNEVWIHGKWYFTEYYPSGLNQGWFLSDAGKADPTDIEHGIFVSSWKPTGVAYPLVWDRTINWVPALNVTDRYIDIYKKAQAKNPLKEGEAIVNVVLMKKMACSPDSDSRVDRQVVVFEEKGDRKITGGHTPSATDDLNNFLKLRLKKGESYRFEYPDVNGSIKKTVYKVTEENDQRVNLSQEE